MNLKNEKCWSRIMIRKAFHPSGVSKKWLFYYGQAFVQNRISCLAFWTAVMGKIHEVIFGANSDSLIFGNIQKEISVG